MKKQIKSTGLIDDFRVVSLGIDIVIPADMDASTLENYFNDRYIKLDTGDLVRSAACDFKEDVTYTYEKDYPEELFI